MKLLLVFLHISLDCSLLVAELLLLFEFLQEFSDRVVHGDGQRNLVLRALTFLLLLLYVADLPEDNLRRRKKKTYLFTRVFGLYIKKLFLGILKVHNVLRPSHLKTAFAEHSGVLKNPRGTTSSMSLCINMCYIKCSLMVL